jgi:predicted AlkP superfamily phosphohydrolase/phosphomutase
MSRVLLLGIDGATFSVLDPLMEDGVMPNLAELTTRGVRSPLLSTPHPLTPAAWTSIATGRTPGSHGIYDFVRVERHDGRLSYTLGGSGDVARETIWSIASREGLRVAVLNFPCTFPPPQVDGFVVPGFVPWNYLPRAVHPRDLWRRLEALAGFNPQELAMDLAVERKALQGLPEGEIEGWIEAHAARERQWFEITAFLLHEERPDLTAVVLDVDKPQHVCYHLLDPTHSELWVDARAARLRERCLEYFRRLDGFVGELVTLAGAAAQVFLVSDHGFRLAGEKIFYANVWLEQAGYLKWADGVPLDAESRLTLDGHTETSTLFDWSGTTACALTASGNGIFLVPGLADGDAVRDRLAEELLAFRDPETCELVLADVLKREVAFPGGRMEQAPDLTLVLADRSFLSVLRADAPLKQRRALYGTHDPEGIFAARGPGIREGHRLPPASVVAIAPTVLYALGLPIPADLEAEPILSAFEPDYVAAHPVIAGPRTHVPGEPEAESLDSEAEEAVLERLRALGYME